MKMNRLFALGLLVAAFGCGDKKSDKPADGKGGKAAPTSKAGGAGPAKTPAAPAAKAIEAPKTVLAYGGLNSAAATADALHGLGTQVIPQTPPLKNMIAPVMQQEFKLKDAKVIDLNKPIRFAMFDRKQFGRAPEALMFGITSADALAKALPDTGKKTNVDGNGFTYLKYEGATQPVYVNVSGGFAVITRNKDIFPKHKDFFAALGAAKMPESGALHVEVDHIMALYGNQFAAGIAEGRKVMNQAGAAAQMGGQMDTVKLMLDWVEGAAKELDRLTVMLVTRPDGLKIDFRLVPKAGSPLAKSFANFQGSGRASLVAKLPANAPVMMAIDFDPKKLGALSAALSQAFMTKPIFGGDAAKAKPYLDAMAAYMNGMNGEMVMGVLPSASGMQIVSLFGVSDAKGLRAAQDTMAKLYVDSNAKAYYEKMNLKMEYQKDAYSVGGNPVSIIRTQLSGLPPEAMGMMGMMSDFFVQHLAISDSLGVMAYGDTGGKAQVEAFLGGKAPGGLDAVPSVKRALKEAAPKFSFVGWINIIELAKGVKLGGMNPLAGMLADVKSTSGLGISGGINGGNAQLVIDVPIALVKDGFAAFEKTKGAF